MVEGDFYGKDAGVRDEAVGPLEAVGAAPRGGDPYGASLVATDGHVALAGDHEGGTPARGAARRAAVVVGVQDRPGVARVAAAREAQRLADGLADDLAARVQDAGDDGSVGLGDVAFEGGGAVHHRDARDADVVFYRDLLAGEGSLFCAPDRTPPV